MHKYALLSISVRSEYLSTLTTVNKRGLADLDSSFCMDSRSLDHVSLSPGFASNDVWVECRELVFAPAQSIPATHRPGLVAHVHPLPQ